MRGFFNALIVLLTMSLATPASAQIDKLLSLEKAPQGVVFEVVEGNESALSWVLPRIDGYSKKLREKFPGVPIAVVTHGNEQFGLVADFSGPKARSIRKKALNMSEAGTEIHVCGGHAEAKGVSAAAFPEHINVAQSGPAQVRKLMSEGYILVQLRR